MHYFEPYTIEYSIEEIHSFCKKVYSILSKFSDNRHINILLEGDIGAGKTTFTHEFVKIFDPEIQANSPTYTLINEYKFNHQKIYHLDLFRIKHESELEELGLEDIFSFSGISLIEWWQIAKNYIQEPAILLEFHVIHPEKRSVNIKVYQP